MKITKMLQNLIFYFFLCFLFISCSDSSDFGTAYRNPSKQKIKIHYKYNFKDEVNTFDLYVKKDLIEKGVAEMDFWFDEEEQDSIISIAQEIKFFNFPDTLSKGSDSLSMAFDPDPGIQFLRIQYLSRDKTVYWYIDNDFEIEKGKINRITKLIRTILSEDSEYQSLPEAKGYYL